MTGQCKDCGNTFLLDEMWEAYGCPVCRMARVAKAFKPIDPLRTALGIGTLHTNIDWGSPEWRGVKARADAAMNQDGTWNAPEEEQTEVPRNCKIPKTAEDQVYQLKRLFRL
jgi:DNA-directed RNA polymerase subunit RPC12/RpoP